MNQFPEVQIDVDGFASLTNRKADIFFSKSEEAETEEAEDLNHSSLSGGHQADTQEKPTKKKQKRRCRECAGCQKEDNCGDCAPCTSWGKTSHTMCKARRCNWIHLDEILTSLKNLFLQMESSRRSFVDPQEFVSQISIDPYIQQDAQEFSKHFLPLIKKNQSVKRMVESQFRGEYSHITTCLTCNTLSAQPSQFYELDLALEGNNSLQDCLDDFTKVEKMT